MTSALALLYVDDDADIRMIVEMALGLDPAISVRMARSGAEALRLAAASDWRPDVLALDILMPGMDGVETLRALRALPGLETVPALFMTAKGRDADVARYLAEGAIGVILKPFDPLSLAADIRALIGRP